MEDLYPSRTGGRGGIQLRKDPVVHASAARSATGPLSPAQVERFEHDGFLRFDDFLAPEEVGEFEEELRRILRDRRDDPSPEVVREPGSREVRSVFRVHETSPLFRRAVRRPALLGAAEQLLGSPVYCHQSRINFKPGFDGREFSWHSDFETWHVEDGLPRMRALSLSINLTENTPINGPLLLIPGSQAYFVACPGRTPRRHYEQSLRRQRIGVPEPRHVEWLVERAGGIEVATGPPGSAVLFDCNVVHGSNGNITPSPRSNVFFVFNSVENAPVAPFCGLPRRPGHIASRRCEPLEPEE